MKEMLSREPVKRARGARIFDDGRDIKNMDQMR